MQHREAHMNLHSLFVEIDAVYERMMAMEGLRVLRTEFVDMETVRRRGGWRSKIYGLMSK